MALCLSRFLIFMTVSSPTKASGYIYHEKSSKPMKQQIRAEKMRF